MVSCLVLSSPVPVPGQWYGVSSHDLEQNESPQLQRSGRSRKVLDEWQELNRVVQIHPGTVVGCKRSDRWFIKHGKEPNLFQKSSLPAKEVVISACTRAKGVLMALLKP